MVAEALKLVALRCSGNTAAHLKIYNKPETAEAIEGNNESQGQYSGRIEKLAPKTMTRPAAQVKCLSNLFFQGLSMKPFWLSLLTFNNFGPHF